MVLAQLSIMSILQHMLVLQGASDTVLPTYDTMFARPAHSTRSNYLMAEAQMIYTRSPSGISVLISWSIKIDRANNPLSA